MTKAMKKDKKMTKKKSIQFCPRCKSKNIRASNLVPVGDPLKSEAFFGWECLDCGYSGKDFFIVDEDEYEKILDKKTHPL